LVRTRWRRWWRRWRRARGGARQCGPTSEAAWGRAGGARGPGATQERSGEGGGWLAPRLGSAGGVCLC
jgi:hypothetical protein